MRTMSMGTIRRILLLLLIILCSAGLVAQEAVSTGDRVAVLLEKMPVDNMAELEKQMEEMTAIGPEGRKQITAMVLPPGTGDDVAARFAVGSYSMYLSAYGHSNQGYAWEEECIKAVQAADNTGVKSFFLSQLQYIGTEKSVEYASGFLSDPKLCEQALAVIAACDSPDKEALLAMSLQISSLPCPASVMNELADMKSGIATNEYISWYTLDDAGVQAAALNAMAESASTKVCDVLVSAAADAGYGWDRTGATAALVSYARNIGDKGNVKGMDKICRDLIKKGAVNYKLAALEAMVHVKGHEALAKLLDEYKRGDGEYRKGILSLSAGMPGSEVTARWMEMMHGVNEAARAEIIHMLGTRGDTLAVPAIRKALFCPHTEVRTEAAGALAEIQGEDAICELIDYIRSYVTDEDQLAGYNALITLADSSHRDIIVRSIEGSDNISKRTMLSLLAAGGGEQSLDAVYRIFEKGNAEVRQLAYDAMKNWPDHSSAKALAEICASGNKNYSERAFYDYLALVSASGLSADKKLSLLKKIKPYALRDEQKSRLKSMMAAIREEG
ncbi:MAG: HEAT repeat domain-containing protein [Bacteroidales bacterium]